MMPQNKFTYFSSVTQHFNINVILCVTFPGKENYSYGGVRRETDGRDKVNFDKITWLKCGKNHRRTSNQRVGNIRILSPKPFTYSPGILDGLYFSPRITTIIPLR
jgi:hypothetical protein